MCAWMISIDLAPVVNTSRLTFSTCAWRLSASFTAVWVRCASVAKAVAPIASTVVSSRADRRRTKSRVWRSRSSIAHCGWTYDQ